MEVRKQTLRAIDIGLPIYTGRRAVPLYSQCVSHELGNLLYLEEASGGSGGKLQHMYLRNA
jgi:hypothetical protein